MNKTTKEYIKNLTIKETEKAYIAGLLDGEGCFRIDRFKTKHSPIGYQFRTTVEICMCDEPPIKYLANVTNRNYWTRKKPTKGGRFLHVLTWRNAIAANLIRHILPYLIAKKAQAELCLYFEDHITPGRGRTYKLDDLEKCENIRKQVHDLKLA